MYEAHSQEFGYLGFIQKNSKKAGTGPATLGFIRLKGLDCLEHFLFNLSQDML